MTTTFETAKVGDRVWASVSGWGTIKSIDDSEYPITVYYDNGEYDTYTIDGVLFKDGGLQVLFWDEVVIEAPVKPMPALQVDAKVLVWRDGSRSKFCRHFSHFENNNIHVFDGGLSSWTGNSSAAWDNWELAE